MITESLLIKEGIAEHGSRRPGNYPQMAVFSDLSEHFRDTEGLDEVGAIGIFETRWKEDEIGVATVARRTLGTGFGEH